MERKVWNLVGCEVGLVEEWRLAVTTLQGSEPYERPSCLHEGFSYVFFIYIQTVIMSTMFDISIEQIIVTLGYIGIFGLMISNGVISFPSSQILYIITGFFIFTGELNLALTSLIGALGNTIGNIVLYELARKKGLKYISTFKIFPLKEIKKIQIVFEKRGAWFIFLGKLLPAIKVFVPIVAGIGLMNRALYIPIIFITSLLWSFIFIGIGYFFGGNTELFGIYPVILIVVALVVVFVFYRYMNSQSVIKEMTKLDSN